MVSTIVTTGARSELKAPARSGRTPSRFTAPVVDFRPFSTTLYRAGS
jgi:hypothetical protein